MGSKIDRTNEENISHEGYIMRIVEYHGNKNMIIEFQDKYKTKIKCAYKEFKNGGIKNPYHPSVYNVGYIGVGKYHKNTHKEIYQSWRDMLKRCYDPYELNKYPTYIDCYVYEEWCNFQEYAKWHESNHYEIFNQRMHLDKDILVKGNKIYSPDTCIFVPERVNELFTKSDVIRGEYPIGVNYHKQHKKLQVRCNTLKEKRKHLGYFPLNKPFQAFTAYKNFKENYIKEVADEYKDLIPQKLYEAMYNYEVEIND